ncbi:MAG: CAP domain-containing protein [Actinomycetia bacterium]|nr:CAP domain-containing protein [Actinomycetes bacterium]MCP5034650.1 CAP domain-containing protein [Actinomycetes bacterium]
MPVLTQSGPTASEHADDPWSAPLPAPNWYHPDEFLAWPWARILAIAITLVGLGIGVFVVAIGSSAVQTSQLSAPLLDVVDNVDPSDPLGATNPFPDGSAAPVDASADGAESPPSPSPSPPPTSPGPPTTAGSNTSSLQSTLGAPTTTPVLSTTLVPATASLTTTDPPTTATSTSLPATASPTTPPPTTPPPTTTAPTSTSAGGGSGPVEQQILNLVNVERSSAGCGALTLNTQLNNAADAHSEDMAINDYFDHTGLDGSKPWDRASAAGYQNSFIGENIAYGYRSSEAVMNGWMNSSGHRANILNCRYNHLGVGVSSQGNYWTQLFGGG